MTYTDPNSRPASVSAPSTPKARWAAVFALATGAFALVASEFLPVSLLTPIADDLAVSGGLAGQGIAASGVFAVATSLTIGSLAGRFDRKWVLWRSPS